MKEKIRSFIAMDLMAEADKLIAKGHNIISLALGEPDLKAPSQVIAACSAALKKNQTYYTDAQGSLELRNALVQHYQKTYGVKIKAEQVFIGAGSSPMILAALGALLNRGDEVVLADIHYPCYPNFLHFLGAKIAHTPSKKTKAIWISNPDNPTGYVYRKKELADLAKLNHCIISDEIYHGLNYQGRDHCILEFTKNAIVIGGFSKAYCMTGFRLGYVIMPDPLIELMRKLVQNFYISPNAFVQQAGITALKYSETIVNRSQKIFSTRRDLMISELSKIGLKPAVTPDGAFYIWIDLRKYTQNSFEFCMKLLHQKHVAITPGIDFGAAGEGFVRLAYTCDASKIKLAIRRLGDFLHSK